MTKFCVYDFIMYSFLHWFCTLLCVHLETWTLAQIQNATRQHLVLLMLHSLQAPGPNLAHWLLGFQIQKSIAKTSLQDPGKVAEML